MRRKDRAVADPSEIREILDRADACRIGFAVRDVPYVVAMNFGYRWTDRLTLFFHCAREGRKLRMMEENPNVCFQMDIDRKLKTGEQPCGWGMHYRSLFGTGMLSRIVSPAERIDGLRRILEHYGFAGKGAFDESILEATDVLKLVVDDFSAKKNTG